MAGLYNDLFPDPLTLLEGINTFWTVRTADSLIGDATFHRTFSPHNKMCHGMV
jgi:hypothetical protein